MSFAFRGLATQPRVASHWTSEESRKVYLRIISPHFVRHSIISFIACAKITTMPTEAHAPETPAKRTVKPREEFDHGNEPGHVGSMPVPSPNQSDSTRKRTKVHLGQAATLEESCKHIQSPEFPRQIEFSEKYPQETAAAMELAIHPNRAGETDAGRHSAQETQEISDPAAATAAADASAVEWMPLSKAEHDALFNWDRLVVGVEPWKMPDNIDEMLPGIESNSLDHSKYPVVLATGVPSLQFMAFIVGREGDFKYETNMHRLHFEYDNHTQVICIMPEGTRHKRIKIALLCAISTDASSNSDYMLIPLPEEKMIVNGMPIIPDLAFIIKRKEHGENPSFIHGRPLRRCRVPVMVAEIMVSQDFSRGKDPMIEKIMNVYLPDKSEMPAFASSSSVTQVMVVDILILAKALKCFELQFCVLDLNRLRNTEAEITREYIEKYIKANSKVSDILMFIYNHYHIKSCSL